MSLPIMAKLLFIKMAEFNLCLCQATGYNFLTVTHMSVSSPLSWDEDITFCKLSFEDKLIRKPFLYSLNNNILC